MTAERGSLKERRGVMNINDVTMGMTPQEKEIYFDHMGRRHKEEAEKLDTEKARLKAYKDELIKDILKNRKDYI